MVVRGRSGGVRRVKESTLRENAPSTLIRHTCMSMSTHTMYMYSVHVHVGEVRGWRGVGG